jgi:conjugal transfer pilin signal peptidase TrbI
MNNLINNLKLCRLIISLVQRLSFLKRGKQWLKGIFCFLIVFALITWLKNHVCLLYSSTDSLPYRTYLRLKQMGAKKGDYTSFASPWYGGNVVKRIAGVEGDSITYDKEGNLWIGRQLKVGKPKEKAKDGRPLTPLPPGIIPKGMVFVMGEHERSFDSRYEELGLIPQAALQGRLIALL